MNELLEEFGVYSDKTIKLSKNLKVILEGESLIIRVMALIYCLNEVIKQSFSDKYLREITCDLLKKLGEKEEELNNE